jgi:hypothetical protein
LSITKIILLWPRIHADNRGSEQTVGIRNSILEVQAVVIESKSGPFNQLVKIDFTLDKKLVANAEPLAVANGC